MRRFLVTDGFTAMALALAAGVFMAACLASNEPRSGPGPDALGDGSEPPRACTLIGCADGLAVALESGSEWPDGTYRFDIQVDDVNVMCRASLPVPPCTGSRDIPPISIVTCDPMGVVQIVESGCALEHLTPGTLGLSDTVTAQGTPGPGTPTSSPVSPPAFPPVTHGFPQIVFDSKLRPQRVAIAVSWNGKLVGRTQFVPGFEKVQPNGPACPPTCYVARSTLVLDFQGPGA